MALAHFSLDFIAYETVPVCTYCWETNSIESTNGYAVSKAILNRVNQVIAVDRPDVFFAAGDPGWCSTRMGTASAPLTPEFGASGLVWLAVAPKEEIGASGLFFHDKKELKY
jgi:hypothetical protein